MKNFISILQELLDENGLSIKSFAKLIDVHWDIIYAYKNENYLPSIKTAVKIANYFHCSIDYLMGLDQDKDNSDSKPNYEITKFFPRYKDLLDKNKITHNALSKLININNSSLMLWREGKYPKMDSLIKIANHFGVSIDYLIGRSDNP